MSLSKLQAAAHGRARAVKYNAYSSCSMMLYWAKQHAEPPDTMAQRDAKQRMVDEWLKTHKAKKCPAGFSSVVAFRDDVYG